MPARARLIRVMRIQRSGAQRTIRVPAVRSKKRAVRVDYPSSDGAAKIKRQMREVVDAASRKGVDIDD